MPSTPTLDVLPQLDDRDVTVLYEIVSIAQQSRKPPIRALFEAYEQVQQQPDSDPDLGSKYFRFLSHAGSELARDGTSGIVNRFRALLAKVGIRLVLEGGDDVSVAAVSDNQEEQAEQPEIDHRQDRGRRRRRASFNDSNLDTTWISGDRIIQDTAEENVRQTRQASVEPYQARPRVQAARNRDPPGLRHAGPTKRAFSSEQAQQEARLRKQARKAQARTFLYTTLARRCLWRWHAQTVQGQRKQDEMYQVAILHDKQTLLKQSFAQLRDAVFDCSFWDQQGRRAGRARDLFLLTKAFTHWAQSAADEVARTNIAKRHILRTRYFNAWRDITAVNELKCRRVGLRKFFDIWRAKTDIRQENDAQAIQFYSAKTTEKAYRAWFWAFCDRRAPVWKDFRLQGAAFDKLKDRYLEAKAQDLAADGACVRRLQSTALASVCQRASKLSHNEKTASESRRHQLLSSTFLSLCRRRQYDPRELQVRRNTTKRLLRSTLIFWWTKTHNARLATQVSEQRMLNNAWTAWNDRLRSQTLQIKIEDRLLVHCLYKWVLQERLSMFCRVTEHREKAAALQRLNLRATERQFQLNESAQILERNMHTRLLRGVLTKMNTVTRAREHDDLAAVELRNSKDLPRAFGMWKQQCERGMRLELWSSQARFYSLASGCIKKWQDATVASQRKRRRDAYAAFRRQSKMTLARRCLHAMRTRTAELQRLRDHEAELAAAKRLDIYLNYFNHWRDMTAKWQANEQYAGNIIARYRVGDVLSAMSLRLSEIEERYNQANSVAREAQDRAASRTFRRLGDRLFVLERQSDTAQAWQDRKFNQHRREMLRHWASMAAQRQAMRYGDDQGTPSKNGILRASRNSRSLGPDDFASSTRIGDISDFDTIVGPAAEADTSFGATPLPGYLRTPSRKAPRSRARFRSAATPAASNAPLDFGSSVIGSTTPAPFAPGNVLDMETLTPQITPFQRKMRAGGYSGSTTPMTVPQVPPRSGLRFGRSSALRDTGRTVRFGNAIDEDGSLVGDADQSPSRR